MNFAINLTVSNIELQIVYNVYSVHCTYSQHTRFAVIPNTNIEDG